MFTGFVKGIPMEIEEAALIDGCSPFKVYTQVLIPILKPTIISTAILELMWVWNDYLLPTLVLDIKKYRTIPMAVQYFRGSFGHVQMGPMMAPQYHDRHHSHHYRLSCLPEIHYRGRCGRRGEGMMQIVEKY